MPAAVLRALAMMALAVGACSGTANSRAPSGDGGTAFVEPVEVLSWWNRTGGSDPFGAVVATHRARHPAEQVINSIAQFSGPARKALRTRVLRGEPPDLFQANAGGDLMQWVMMNGMDARDSVVVALDDLVPKTISTWRRDFSDWVLNEVSYGGKLYAIPSEIHRINSAYYNLKVMARFGLTPPKTLDELKLFGRKLAGTGIAPIAVGSNDPWTLALLIFENLLVSQHGPDFYTDYFLGTAQADDKRMRETLNMALTLLPPLLNADHPRLSWLQAVEQVVRGEAAMTVIGDWAKVAFDAQGQVAGRDYVELPFPGTSGTFVYTSDTFAVAHGARNPQGAVRVLSTIASIEGQLAVAKSKGAVPARGDMSNHITDPAMKEKYDALQSATRLLAQSGIVPPIFSRDVNASLAEMMAKRDTEPVIHTLRSRYPLLWRRNGWGTPRERRAAPQRAPAGIGTGPR